MPTDERSRICRQSSKPSTLGQHQVEQHDVGSPRSRAAQRIVAVGGTGDVEAANGEVGADQVDDVGVVLDQQDLGGRVARPRSMRARSAAAGGQGGRVAAGTPTAQSRWFDRQPHRRGRALGRRVDGDRAAVRLDDAAGDRQAQASSRGVRAPGVGARTAASARPAGSPGPSSTTRISTGVARADRHPTSTRTFVPGGLWRTALSTRLTNTCSRRSWSAQHRRDVRGAPRGRWRRAARPAGRPPPPRRRSPRSHQSRAAGA